MDFGRGGDAIWLDRDVFKALDVGRLASKAFFAGADAHEARDSADRIIFDTVSGKLYYDRDGVDGARAKLLAILNGSPELSYQDFLVVA